MELVERLQQLDEMTILELLDVTSEELPLLLIDQVEYKYDQLLEYLDEGEDEQD